jgi:GH15 family glucan-1,4-alpha-glucosidase
MLTAAWSVRRILSGYSSITIRQGSGVFFRCATESECPLRIPWGESFDDDADFGYHLVWTRDMCNSATALLASGEKDKALRALIFLATVQREDGAFYQNFRVDGTARQTNLQLDEIAFPIMLAWRLDHEGALQNFDPYPMVRRAAAATVPVVWTASGEE